MVNFAQIIGISTVILLCFALLFWFLVTVTQKKKKVLKEKPKALIEAESLLTEGYYNLSIIRSFVAIEKSLKEILKSKDPAFELIDQAFTIKKLSKNAKDTAHSMRVLRNKLVHESDIKVTPEDAKKYLLQAKSVLTELGYQTN